MTRHLLKLLWHRKRANALIMAEIFFSFLIVFTVVTIAVTLWSRWQSPIGYQWKDVWTMSVESSVRHEASGTFLKPGIAPKEKTQKQQTAEDVDRMLQEVRRFPQVIAAAADSMPPYMGRTWTAHPIR